MIGVSADAEGGIYVAGNFKGTLDLGLTPLISFSDPPPMGSYTNENIFVAKFDAAGNTLWNESFPSPRGSETVAVTGGDGGHLLLLGWIPSEYGLGQGPIGPAPNATFVAQLDAEGGVAWARSFKGVPQSSLLPTMARGASGDIVITGDFADNALDFGGEVFPPSGMPTGYLARLDATGAHLFTEVFPGMLTYGCAAAGDAAGNAYAGGHFGPGPDGVDLGLIKVDPVGNVLWNKPFAGTARALGLDGAGEVLATGRLDGPADFGLGPLLPPGDTGAFVAKLDSNGAPIWNLATGPALLYSIAPDPVGNIVLAGDISASPADAGAPAPVDFGGGPLGLEVRALVVVKLDPDGKLLWNVHLACDECGLTRPAQDELGNVIVVWGGPLAPSGPGFSLAMFPP